MKRKISFILIGIILLGGLMTTPIVASQEVIEWKLQSSYPLGSAAGSFGPEWAKNIEKISNGRIKIKVFPPGAICAVKDTIDYLKRGVLQAASTYGGFYTGLIPETDLEIGLPLGHQNIAEIWDAYINRGLGEIIKEAYAEHGAMQFLSPADDYYHFMSNFPVKKLEDFKGKKIRALGIFGKYVQAIGASPVVVPGAEMYMAMKLGTIDGAIYGATGLKDIKLNEVVKYYTFPTAAHISGSILIGTKAVEKLSPDLQAIVKHSTQKILWELSLSYINKCHQSMIYAEKQGTTQRNYLPEEELVKMRKLVKPLWDELAAKSPRMKKGVDILKQQMRDYGRPME